MTLFNQFGNHTQALIETFLERLAGISLTDEEANYLIQKINERRNAPAKQFEVKS